MRLIRRIMSGFGRSMVLFMMVLAYMSGALIALISYGYIKAVGDNPDTVLDYTATMSFGRATAEYMDALYASVTQGAELNIPPGVEYFAYGINTGQIRTSDALVNDIPSFEQRYAENQSYIYYIKYSAELFRGASRPAGKETTFQAHYSTSATAVFHGISRDYSDSAIILAVLEPKPGFEGFGRAKLDFFLLNNAMQALVLLIGIALVSFSIVISAGSRRRRVDRVIARAVSWVYFEIKLLVFVAALWAFTGAAAKREFFGVIAVFFGLVAPITYALMCNAKHSPKTFFKNSAIHDFYLYLKRIYDIVVPVMPLQLKLRKQIIKMFIFGFVAPIAAFLICDAILGQKAVRLLVPVYILYFAAFTAAFVYRYARLVNEVSELSRLTAVLPLGDRVPPLEFEEGDDLYELAINITRTDQAVSAAADMMARRQNKKLSELSQKLGELTERTQQLKSMLTANASVVAPEDAPAVPENPESQIAAAQAVGSIAALTDSMRQELLRDAPVGAPVLKRMDFLALLEEVINSKMPELYAAKLNIRRNLPNPPAYITADPAHIQAVLEILVSNVAKYALSGSEMSVVMRKEEQAWRFVIINVESPQTVTQTGTVMSAGLQQAREYLVLNGGKLEHVSDGTKFGISIIFPAAR